MRRQAKHWPRFMPQSSSGLAGSCGMSTQQERCAKIFYVILHELCHVKEHNHSSRYYSLLSKLMPNWQPVKARLDRMVEFIVVR